MILDRVAVFTGTDSWQELPYQRKLGEDDGGGDPDPPIFTDLTIVRRMPLLSPLELTAGMAPGDAMQHMHAGDFCIDDPDSVNLCQDTAGPWNSRDGGRTWYKPTGRGLNSYQGLGICVDPHNPLHVLINMGGSYPSNADYEGVYQSYDGCESFGARIVAGVADARRSTHNSMAFAPGSGLAANGCTNRAIVIAHGTPADGVTGLNYPIRVTANGGVSWTNPGVVWSQTTHGMIVHMIGDASNSGRYYACGSRGLHRITNAHGGGTLTITRLSELGDLPNGAINGKPWVSANGATIIVGIGNNGIWRTNTGNNPTPQWARVGTHSEFIRLSVSPYDPNYAITTTSEATGSNRRPFWCKNLTTAATFTNTTTANTPTRPDSSARNHMVGNYVAVFWKPDGSAFMSGVQTSWPDTNNQYWCPDIAGPWRLANEGNCGCNFSLKGPSPSLFGSATDFIIPIQDLGPNITRNGGLSFKRGSLKANSVTPALDWNSAYGAAVNPTNDTIFSASGNTATLVRSDDNGATWTRPATANMAGAYTIIIGTGSGASTNVFGGRHKSSDDGRTWAVMTDLPSGFVVYDAVTISATQYLFAMNINAAANVGNSVYRSSDQGETWTLVLTMPYSNRITGSKFGPFAAHPANQNRIFTSGPNGYNIREWTLNSGTASTRPSTTHWLFGASTTPPAEYGTPIQVSIIAIDPRHPEIIRVGTNYAGSPRIYESIDAGASWDGWDGTRCPFTFNLNAMMVNPYTGDFLYGGSAGVFCRKPTYEQTSPPTSFSLLPYDAYLTVPT